MILATGFTFRVTADEREKFTVGVYAEMCDKLVLRTHHFGLSYAIVVYKLFQICVAIQILVHFPIDYSTHLYLLALKFYKLSHIFARVYFKFSEELKVVSNDT